MFPIPSLEIAVIASWEVHPLQPIIEVAKYTKSLQYSQCIMYHMGRNVALYCPDHVSPCSSFFGS